jgi:micrococcal nuclease
MGMGDVVPFRNKRRWTRPEDYGHFPEPPGKRPDRPPRKRGSRTRKTRWAWLFWPAASAALAFWVLKDPALIDPPSWLSADPESVKAHFTRCGEKDGTDCVIDGATFKLDKRTIRIIGIETPETLRPACVYEGRLGERAAAALLRLLNQGPFTMTARFDKPTDKHGRELLALKRAKPDGTTQSIAHDMVAGGTVHRYRSDSQTDWCRE